MVIVVDDEDRENEGDIIVASDSITPQQVAFMMNHARGLICVAMPGERLDALDIPLMVSRNTESLKTAFTVSVDYIPARRQVSPQPTAQRPCERSFRKGRARKISHARATSFRCAPTRRAFSAVTGHTEAAVDLCRLAGKFLPAPFAKSPMTMAPWPACRSLKSLPKPRAVDRDDQGPRVLSGRRGL